MGDGFDHFFRKHGPDVMALMALAFGEPTQVSHAWTAVEFAYLKKVQSSWLPGFPLKIAKSPGS